MKTSEQINEIATALSLAQGEMDSASKTTVNPFFKSTYSSLPQIWEVAKIPLRKNKLVLVQDLVTTEKGISVTTRICHASGQWMEFGPLEIPSTKKDAQGLGSAASYGRRYALAAALSIVSDDDDDGNAACAPTLPAQKKEAPKKEDEKKREPNISLDEVYLLEELIGDKKAIDALKKECLKLFETEDFSYMSRKYFDTCMEKAKDNLKLRGVNNES